MDQRAFSIREVAEQLGCYTETVRRMIRTKQLPAFRVGVGRKVLRVPASALQELMDGQAA